MRTRRDCRYAGYRSVSGLDWTETMDRAGRGTSLRPLSSAVCTRRKKCVSDTSSPYVGFLFRCSWSPF
jgi:hypothetical protein